jgi:hypothetical protein
MSKAEISSIKKGTSNVLPPQHKIMAIKKGGERCTQEQIFIAGVARSIKPFAFPWDQSNGSYTQEEAYPWRNLQLPPPPPPVPSSLGRRAPRSSPEASLAMATFHTQCTAMLRLSASHPKTLRPPAPRPSAPCATAHLAGPCTAATLKDQLLHIVPPPALIMSHLGLQVTAPRCPVTG